MHRPIPTVQFLIHRLSKRIKSFYNNLIWRFCLTLHFFSTPFRKEWLAKFSILFLTENFTEIIFTDIFLYHWSLFVLSLIIIIKFLQNLLTVVEIIILIKNRGFTILMNRKFKKVKVCIFVWKTFFINVASLFCLNFKIIL